MEDQPDETIQTLKKANKRFQHQFHEELPKHVQGQQPKIAVLTCSDSRVIPELIFQQPIGTLFVVRVAGNIAVDSTVIASLEYAVEHLHISHLIILGHQHCGAVQAAENMLNPTDPLMQEIQQSFSLNEQDHVHANLTRQLTMLPKRSTSIQHALSEGKLHLIGAIYHLSDGSVEFIQPKKPLQSNKAIRC